MARKMIRRITLTASVLSLVASFSACKERQQAQQAAPPDVEVVTVEQKDVPIYREFVGTLAGDVNATISAQVTGYLLSRDYVEGSFVTNGQVLFQIDPAPFKAALDKAKAQLAQAQAQEHKYALDVKRYRPLAATQAISQQDLDDAIQGQEGTQAQVDAAQAAVEQAALSLGFTIIRSPLDGLAGLARAQVGDLLGPSSGELTTVSKVEPIRVYFSISQEMAMQLQEQTLAEGKASIRTGGEGHELELILASGTVYPQKGRVRFANNQVDVKTGTITVVGEFPNPKLLLAPGMFVRVRGVVDTDKNALLVPQQAVAELQGRHLIALVGADNKVSIRPVTVGEWFGRQWVINGNINAGDRVVAEGIQKVHDGAVVHPVPYVEKIAAAGPDSAPPTGMAAEKKPSPEAR